MNNDTPWPSIVDARQRVLDFQRKLHRWTKQDKGKRFRDLFNLVYDRATLTVAWERIRSNKGSKTSGVDGATRWRIEKEIGTERFLEGLRNTLKERTYRPQPVRQKGIPKSDGRVRYLGIPTVADRVVQMALKLVLEPIFEVDFYPSSYGYRPARRAQDAIAEIVHFINPRSQYTHVVEGDIKGCFDNVHHGTLMGLVRQRIEDRHVLDMIRAILRAGVVEESGRYAATLTGTPQGGIISPLLTNIYLSVLDRHFEAVWQHHTRYVGCSTYYRRKGLATYRLVRYADDFVILVRGTREQAEAVREEAARVLQDELKMELSLEKTLVTHVDEGFDFLGHHIRRVSWKGAKVGWTFPSRKSLNAIRQKVKSLTTRSRCNLSLKTLLILLNPILRGWANYFRYDASKRTFSYVGHYAWWRVFRWLRKKHAKRTWRYIRQRYCGGRWEIQENGLKFFQPAQVKVERYRYRGQRILLPWMDKDELGEDVGFYAAGMYDDPSFLGDLEEKLLSR